MGFIASIQKSLQRDRMKKKTLKLKTSLQCNGCVQRIKPHLDDISELESWDVNLQSPKKTLKAVVPEESAEHISKAMMHGVAKEGYDAEKMN